MAYLEDDPAITPAEVRPTLLYFLELYIQAYDRDIYFSRGHITTAKKINAFCEEIQYPPLKYIQIVFDMDRKSISQFGFNFVHSIPTQRQFLKVALDGSKKGLNYSFSTMFDRLKKEYAMPTATPVIDGKDLTRLLYALVSGAVSKEMLIYAVITGHIDAPDFTDFLNRKHKTLQPVWSRFEKMIRRGILPDRLPELRRHGSFLAWAKNFPTPPGQTTNPEG